MTQRISVVSTTLAGLALLSAGLATAESKPVVYRTLPIDVDPRPPIVQVVPGDDEHNFIVYDLLIANWSAAELTIARIEAEDANNGRVLASYDAVALDDPLRLRTSLQVRRAGPDRVLGPGRTALASIAVVLAAGDPIPAALRHRIRFDSRPDFRLIESSGKETDVLVAVSEPLRVDAAPPVVLGPPLTGGPWRCSNGLGLGNGHAAVYTAWTARIRMPQRYGCDFQKLDDKGNILPNPFPDDITNEWFYGYGAEVLAVADGIVTSVRDGIPENVPRADGAIRMPVPLTEDTISGNLVVLDIGNGYWVFYAHLQPGSIPLRVGDRVKRGQRIGLLGNSGNTVGPHLHFQVGDGPLLNASTARAWVLERFTFLGRRAAGPPESAREMERKLPLQDAVMRLR